MTQAPDSNPEGQFPECEYPLRELTEAIIAAAIATHRQLGPGFLGRIYENALAVELELRGHQVKRQVPVTVSYRGRVVGKHKLDLLVDDQVVVELKSVEALAGVHVAQLRSALKAAGKTGRLVDEFQPADADPRSEEGNRLTAPDEGLTGNNSTDCFSGTPLYLCASVSRSPL